MKAAWRFAAGVAIVASAAGCGGAGGESTGRGDRGFTLHASTTVTPGSIKKPQYVARVNRICRHGWKIVLENFAEYSSWQSPRLSKRELFAKSVRNSFLLGLDYHIYDDILELEAPRGERATVEDLVGKMQIAVERGERERHAHSPAQLSAQFADYNRAARRYGLDQSCLVDGQRLLEAMA